MWSCTQLSQCPTDLSQILSSLTQGKSSGAISDDEAPAAKEPSPPTLQHPSADEQRRIIRELEASSSLKASENAYVIDAL
jgi:hypothetical protein